MDPLDLEADTVDGATLLAAEVLPPGTRVGPYVVGPVLGRGGMGIVYRAERPDLGRAFALKLVRPSRLESPDALPRFLREARAASGLAGHPGIVGVHDVGQDGAHCYLAMDLVEGPSLRELCRDDGVPPVEAARLVAQAARAVAFAHSRGVLHRDVKPGNILVGADGAARVADFGLAAPAAPTPASTRLTRTGASVGTPAYMAPEQVRGEPADLRTDVWGLGATLYEACTGRAPFDGGPEWQRFERILRADPPSPRRVAPAVSRDLETVALTCLAKDPAGRYPTADLLADDLERVGRGEPVRARRAGPLRRLAHRARRHPRAVGAGLLVAATAGVVAVVAAVGVVRARARVRDTLALARELVATDPDRALGLVEALGAAVAPDARAALAASAESSRAALATRALALQAEGLLATAREARPRHAAALERFERLLRAPPPAASPEQGGDAERQRQRELVDARRTLDAEWGTLESVGRGVLALAAGAPDLPAAAEARGTLADEAWHRLRAAEERGDADEAARFLARLVEHGADRYARELAGEGALALATDPPGAAVERFRHQDEGGVAVPRRFEPRCEDCRARRGTHDAHAVAWPPLRTPLADVRLPMGSYLLVLTHPDRPPVRYPVAVGRLETAAPAEPVALPTAEAIGEGYVWIPGGDSVTGTGGVGPNGGPRAGRTVAGFCLARDEVRVADYRAFLEALLAGGAAVRDVLARCPREASGGGHYWAVRDGTVVQARTEFADDIPVLGISWDDAVAYCGWRSRVEGRTVRLPTELEWERAARGADGRAYPWGDGFAWNRTVGGWSTPGAGRPMPRPVGSATTDVSPFGVRDLGGNIKEWCADGWLAETRAVRGGGWANSDPAPFHAAYRTAVDRRAVGSMMGLRVAAELRR